MTTVLIPKDALVNKLSEPNLGLLKLSSMSH